MRQAESWIAGKHLPKRLNVNESLPLAGPALGFAVVVCQSLWKNVGDIEQDNLQDRSKDLGYSQVAVFHSIHDAIEKRQVLTVIVNVGGPQLIKAQGYLRPRGKWQVG